MFGPTIACLVLGLAAGIWSARRYLPALAPTREGTIASWVVRCLFGCAVAWAALQIYLAVHAYANLHSDEFFPHSSDNRSEILIEMVQSILLQGGLLLGSAAVVYLLAPPARTES
jgi:hypothetical protein